MQGFQALLDVAGRHGGAIAALKKRGHEARVHRKWSALLHTAAFYRPPHPSSSIGVSLSRWSGRRHSGHRPQCIRSSSRGSRCWPATGQIPNCSRRWRQPNVRCRRGGQAAAPTAGSLPAHQMSARSGRGFGSFRRLPRGARHPDPWSKGRPKSKSPSAANRAYFASRYTNDHRRNCTKLRPTSRYRKQKHRSH